MVKLYEQGMYLLNGNELAKESNTAKDEAVKNTMAYQILKAHNKSGGMDKLKIKFDSLASHDITFVGIIQTARASGLKKFPIPYVLTNCHNSLGAVGGTINEDDHVFGLSAAMKYGGIYVPAHMAVIHQYMREMMAGCGKMILGSDSHTRYGALGTMAIGEGGGELAKQLLGHTYDIDRPEVVAVILTGKPGRFVGPQDVALAIIKQVFDNGFVKNKVMEFVGDGIKNLSVEYRSAIDVMTTETTCLSSIWVTDECVKEYYEQHGRTEDYAKLKPSDVAYYDGAIHVDLSQIKPMIALPFHPSKAYTIDEVLESPLEFADMVDNEADMLFKNAKVKFSMKKKIRDGGLFVEQGVIAGCAGGTFDSICEAAGILDGGSAGSGEFTLSVYPSSQPTFAALVENGTVSKLMAAGATVRSAFCGPCFGAGDVPSAGSLSIRHTTRNFPNREGSKPSSGQIAAVALMDARSIAATALNKGRLTSAEHINKDFAKPKYYFNKTSYDSRVYFGYGNPNSETELRFGPNIVDWPEMPQLGENMLLQAACIINDPVTTTDELIPSGETSSFRSNPLGLAEFTLSRKDPDYVPRAKKIRKAEELRLAGENPINGNDALVDAVSCVKMNYPDINIQKTQLGSFVYAKKPGDGSAREQAASCQKVLGGLANIACEYATKRYRSNLINWGMLPFVFKDEIPFEIGDFIFIPNIAAAIRDKKNEITAYAVNKGFKPFTLELPGMTDDERDIILAGCLINYYKESK